MPGKTLFFRLFAYNTGLFGDIIYFNPVILQEKGKKPESTIMNSDEWGNAMTSSTRELPSLSLALMPVVLTLVVLGVQLFYFEDFTPHVPRSEEHTSELQSIMRISYDVLCLKKKKL